MGVYWLICVLTAWLTEGSCLPVGGMNKTHSHGLQRTFTDLSPPELSQRRALAQVRSMESTQEQASMEVHMGNGVEEAAASVGNLKPLQRLLDALTKEKNSNGWVSRNQSSTNGSVASCNETASINRLASVNDHMLLSNRTANGTWTTISIGTASGSTLTSSYGNGTAGGRTLTSINGHVNIVDHLALSGGNANGNWNTSRNYTASGKTLASNYDNSSDGGDRIASINGTTGSHGNMISSGNRMTSNNGSVSGGNRTSSINGIVGIDDHTALFVGTVNGNWTTSRNGTARGNKLSRSYGSSTVSGNLTARSNGSSLGNNRTSSDNIMASSNGSVTNNENKQNGKGSLSGNRMVSSIRTISANEMVSSDGSAASSNWTFSRNRTASSNWTTVHIVTEDAPEGGTSAGDEDGPALL